MVNDAAQQNQRDEIAQLRSEAKVTKQQNQENERKIKEITKKQEMMERDNTRMKASMVATLFQIQNSRVFQDFQGHFQLFSRIWSIQIPGYSRTEMKFCLIFKNIQGSHGVLSLMNLTEFHNRCRPHFRMLKKLIHFRSISENSVGEELKIPTENCKIPIRLACLSNSLNSS